MVTKEKDSQEIKGLPNRESQTNKRRFPAFLLLCLSAVLCCMSCGERVFYEQYQSIDSKYWEKEAEYYFSFEITNTSIPYDLTLEIRNNNLYPYQNLWVFSQEEQPSGQVQRDTTECILADDYGKWLGTGISLFHSSHVLHTQYFFKEPGTYTIGFRQGMRQDQLTGIQEIGLCITSGIQK